MAKYCQNCGKEHYEDDLVCKECNSPIPENPQINGFSPVNDELSNIQAYPSIEAETPRRKSKALVVIGVLGIMAILIGASFYVLFYSNTEEQNVTKYYLRDDGPKINLQSSLTGSLSPDIEQGYFATYGYYYENEKIGTAYIENAGQEIFQGIGCSKIITTGDMDMSTDVNPIKCTFESFEYRTLEDNTPYYMSINFQYSKPSPFTMSTDYRWDRQDGIMEYTVTLSGKQTNVECTLPDDYWGLFGSMSYLQVGYSKELNYTMNLDTVDPVEVSVIVQVLEREDVSVQNGEYKDCYKINIYQTYELFGTIYSQTFTFWVNDQGIMPQAETTSNSGGTITTFLMKLEEYYTTTPPAQF
jgi:hypothetical protein